VVVAYAYFISTLWQNPRWVPDGGSGEEILVESMSTRQVFPQSTVPVEYGVPKRRLRIVSAMLL